MGFQSNISVRQGFGVAGEVFNDGPRRVEVLTIQSDDVSHNVIGRAFTVVSEGFAQAGGAGVFAGILINPKSHVSYGTDAGTLAPTMTIPNNSHAELLGMGEIVVQLNNAATIGDAVCYDEATGELYAGAPSDGQAEVPNAVVTRYGTTGAGLAVIKLTN